MTNEELQKLRDNGISETTIAAMQAEDNAKGVSSPAAPAAPAALPEVDTNAPSTAISQAQTQSIPTTAPEHTFMDTAKEVGIYAMQNPSQVATGIGAAAAAYAANQIKQGMQARAAPPAGSQMAQSQQMNQAQQVAQGQRAVVNGPAVGTPTPAGDNRVRFPTGQPGPVEPTPGFGAAGEPNPFQPPRPPSLVQQGMDMARKIQQLAFEKVMQGGRAVAPYAQAAGEGLATAGRMAAPYAAPVAVGLTAALMPGNAGGASMMVPQTGRLRGSEINPVTNRPWTPRELQEYAANPDAIDARLPR